MEETQDNVSLLHLYPDTKADPATRGAFQRGASVACTKC